MSKERQRKWKMWALFRPETNVIVSIHHTRYAANCEAVHWYGNRPQIIRVTVALARKRATKGRKQGDGR